MYNLNPTFKRPDAPTLLPGRSPTPPSRHVEPLSPPKPTPIEPSFNYPAINNHVDFTVRPEQAYAATPKSRNRSSSHRSGHHRTPSTIDTLAEAALAVSPHYAPPSSSIANGHAFAFPAPSGHGRGEPPHKRSRSEILTAPLVSQYASRPATSYDGLNGLYGGPRQHMQAGDTDESRIEAASLLLNFRTGGLPSMTSNAFQSVPSGAAPTSRPHANSFPRDIYQPRPVQLASQAGLLPPFNVHDGVFARPALPFPPQTVFDSDPGPSSTSQSEFTFPNTHAVQYPPAPDVEMKDAPPVQTQTLPDETALRATSVSEVSETASKAKRRGSKAKARASSRKSLAEKTATKRAAARKKTPDRSKASRNASEAPGAPVILPRRKSFSSVPPAPSDLIQEATTKTRCRSVPPDTTMVIHPAPKVPRRAPKMAADTVCAGCMTTRETAKLGGEMDAWISCNGCKKWLHVDCAGFKKASDVRDVDKFFCDPCEPTHGKTTYVRKSTRAHASVDYAELQRGVLKTSEESMEHHYIQPIKDGTFQFDTEYFPRMRPELVPREFLERGTFNEPICIPAEWNPRPWLKREHDNSAPSEGNDADCAMDDLMPEDFEYDMEQDVGQDKLGMVMPENLTVRQVCNMAGPDTPLDVIDVKTQNSGSKWTLSRWADYYEEDGDDKPIRNVISLEVSLTRLGRLLRRPQVVRDIDLQDQVWPQKEIDLGKYPKVQFYCLMSVADSYTDFHIDFGGSSVYYHILKGKKTFFFIPPKAKHLKAYEEWNDSPQQNYTFLPSITKECYRVDLSEGDTMLIPSGWIHAVWTPETSLVIGGNFLTRMSFKNQFRVVDIEKANNTPMKFRYPFFQKLMWYTTIQYLETDPLPEDVKQLFFDGKQYERQQPVWADYDGDLAANDSRTGSKNTRYYSQGEIDGLPDLVAYIFHTIMLVMGRIDGISADRMKRINASIPKGHGEPLDLAKTFALWVAWKRGNEHPPAWAHPDAVLPNSKEEGPPKKLSARALKEMERKQAMDAWRVAGGTARPTRAKIAATSSAITNAAGPSTPDRTSSSGHPFLQQHPSLLPPNPSDIAIAHQIAYQQDGSSVPPDSYAMEGVQGNYYSTPKSSVLGPKRVACDSCRRRRIRCKHKDFVTLASPDQIQHISPDGAGHSFSSDLHDNITVTPPIRKESKPVTNETDQQRALLTNGLPTGSQAYAPAKIPMALNGVTLDGMPNKRGRSKACFECRKSKRRCIHDENGNVDPIKAFENPVPRASATSKKRSLPDDTQAPAKKPKVGTLAAGPSKVPEKPLDAHHPTSQHVSSPPPTMNGYHHATQPPNQNSDQPPQIHMSPQPQPDVKQQHFQQQVNHTAPPIDPGLFAQSASIQHGPYQSDSHLYAQPVYPYQSLEQIASEVLDFDPADGPQPNNNVDESVDSAISLPGSDDGKLAKDDLATSSISPPDSGDDAKPVHWQGVYVAAETADADESKAVLEPPASSTDFKGQDIDNGSGVMVAEDEQSLELAKALQQDDLGLRRRSK